MNLKLFKKVDFSLLIFGELISYFGSQFQSFALSLYALKITGSAAQLAAVLAISVVPKIILGPVAGVFVDWLDRKKIVIIINVLNSVVVGALSIISISTESLKMQYIYVAVVILAINSVMFSPAVGTIIPTIMSKEELLDANSINSFVQGIGNIASPMIAGSFYGIFGIIPILVFNSISFLAAAIMELFIKLPKTKEKSENHDFNKFKIDFMEGLKFISNKKLLLAITICAFVINFCFDPITSTAFTYVSKNVFKVSDLTYGIMITIFSLGILFGPALSSVVSKKLSTVNIFFIGLMSIGALIGVQSFVLSHLYRDLFTKGLIPLVTLTILMLVIVSITMIVNIVLNTMFGTMVPNEMLGRVGSVLSVICLAANPLGQILYGVLLDNIPAYMVWMLTSVIFIITMMVFKLIAANKEKTHTHGTINEEII